jgi:large subunit ribosomal protein L9
MDVILNQTIPKVGRQGDVVRVADGFARNFLIPRGLAHEATHGNRRALEGKAKVMDRKSDELTMNAETLKGKLDGQTIQLQGRCAKNSTKLFGAVTTTDIAAAIKDRLHVDVDKRMVGLIHPLKSAGSFPVPLHLHQHVDAEITIEITPTEA